MLCLLSADPTRSGSLVLCTVDVLVRVTVNRMKNCDQKQLRKENFHLHSTGHH